MKKLDSQSVGKLIEQGENDTVEFKEAINAGIAKEMCAFANSKGGRIILGVDDNGRVKGIQPSNKNSSKIYDFARNTDPQIKIELETHKNVLIITIPQGTEKPYSANGKFYIRHGANSQQLKRDEIRDFFRKEGLLEFDEKLNRAFNLKNDINIQAFQNFVRMTGTSPVLKKLAFLENMNLIEDGYMKNAGVLLLCKEITRFIRNGTITCVLFRGIEKFKILDQKEFDADFYSNYQHAFNYLQAKLNTEYIIKGGPREEKLELPESALREAILNAIAHRDYFLGGSIHIYLFSDRVEITNPGGLPKGMAVKDLGTKSIPRNHLLFSMIQRMGLVEKAGTGIVRMKNAMKDYGFRGPDFEINENWFTIVFKRQESNKIGEKFGVSTEKGSEKSSEKILNLIKINKHISANEIAKTIGISQRAVEKHISKLKMKGLLIRIGPAKGGHWKVVEDEK